MTRLFQIVYICIERENVSELQSDIDSGSSLSKSVTLALDLFRKMFMYPYLHVISMFAHNFLKIIFCRKLCYALLRGETDSR